jgi:hypothetical protein
MTRSLLERSAHEWTRRSLAVIQIHPERCNHDMYLVQEGFTSTEVNVRIGSPYMWHLSYQINTTKLSSPDYHSRAESWSSQLQVKAECQRMITRQQSLTYYIHREAHISYTAFHHWGNLTMNRWPSRMKAGDIQQVFLYLHWRTILFSKSPSRLCHS